MIIISTLISVLAYSIKGGWLDHLPQWAAFEYKSYFKRTLPAFLIFSLVVFYVPFLQAALFTLAWCYCYSSMGEEAGAVGDYKGGWGDYLEARKPDGTLYFGRSYGIKKALQWGLAWGALLALISGSGLFILAGATFPICYFIGSSIAQLRGSKGWAYAEPIYGIPIGLAMGVWLGSFV